MPQPLPKLIPLLGAIFAAALSAPSQACSYAQVVIQSSFPADGATGVPTNIAISIYGPDIRTGGYNYSLRTGSGEGVPFEGVPAAPGGLSVHPFQGFEPDTTYVLGVSVDDQLVDSVTFTTGSGLEATPPPRDAPDVDVAVFDYPFGTCGTVTGVCVRGTPATGSLEAWVGEEVLRQPSVAPSLHVRAYSAPVAIDECVEVRVRGASGTLSEPAIACGATLPRYHLPAPSQVAQYTCDDLYAAIEAGSVVPDPIPGAESADSADSAGSAGLPDSDDPAPVATTPAEPPKPTTSTTSGACAVRAGTPPHTSAIAACLASALAALFAARRRRV